MNNLKSKAGFTLVELIVVIAILAILAGVAVPAYSGYITKANEAADYTMLDSVKTAAYMVAVEADPSVVVSTITVEGTTVEVNGSAVDVSDYVTVDFKSDAAGASWTATEGKWTLN